MNKQSTLGNYTLEQYISDLEKNGTHSAINDGDLLDLVIDAVNQEPNDEGLPTDRDILMLVNNALYHHFNEESKWDEHLRREKDLARCRA